MFAGIHVINLKWTDHVRQCKNKKASGVYALNMARHYLTSTDLKTLYYSLIHPHLTYGCLLWGTASTCIFNYDLCFQDKITQWLGQTGVSFILLRNWESCIFHYRMG